MIMFTFLFFFAKNTDFCKVLKIGKPTSSLLWCLFTIDWYHLRRSEEAGSSLITRPIFFWPFWPRRRGFFQRTRIFGLFSDWLGLCLKKEKWCICILHYISNSFTFVKVNGEFFLSIDNFNSIFFLSFLCLAFFNFWKTFWLVLSTIMLREFS